MDELGLEPGTLLLCRGVDSGAVLRFLRTGLECVNFCADALTKHSLRDQKWIWRWPFGYMIHPKPLTFQNYFLLNSLKWIDFQSCFFFAFLTLIPFLILTFSLAWQPQVSPHPSESGVERAQGFWEDSRWFQSACLMPVVAVSAHFTVHKVWCQKKMQVYFSITEFDLLYELCHSGG